MMPFLHYSFKNQWISWTDLKNTHSTSISSLLHTSQINSDYAEQTRKQYHSQKEYSTKQLMPEDIKQRQTTHQYYNMLYVWVHISTSPLHNNHYYSTYSISPGFVLRWRRWKHSKQKWVRAKKRLLKIKNTVL